MMMRKRFLLLGFLFACCFLQFGCQVNDRCDPPEERRLDEEVLNAIPHTDGQRVTYDVSDGTSFEVAFRGGLRPASEDTGCTEQFIMDFTGSNGTHTLSGIIDAYPEAPGFADVFFNFDFNSSRGNRLRVELFGAGDITAGRNATARVLAEITRNGISYQNVLEQEYENALSGQLERVYYNIEFGLLGMELVDGIAIWQR